MSDERKLSLCIPTFNRCDLTLQSFADVYNDERISEIIIVDDFSERQIFNELREKTKGLDKVRLLRNTRNHDCYSNKCIAASFSKNPFLILLDSDNIIHQNYVDKIFEHEWVDDIILAPTWAQPQFDYRAFNGVLLTKENASRYIDKPMMSTALNTCNFFVNRENYVRTWDYKFDPVTADSIYFNYLWLSAGKKIQFVEGLNYFHRVHPQGHYVTNVHRTPTNLLAEIEQKIRELK